MKTVKIKVINEFDNKVTDYNFNMADGLYDLTIEQFNQYLDLDQKEITEEYTEEQKNDDMNSILVNYPMSELNRGIAIELRNKLAEYVNYDNFVLINSNEAKKYEELLFKINGKEYKLISDLNLLNTSVYTTITQIQRAASKDKDKNKLYKLCPDIIKLLLYPIKRTKKRFTTYQFIVKYLYWLIKRIAYKIPKPVNSVLYDLDLTCNELSSEDITNNLSASDVLIILAFFLIGKENWQKFSRVGLNQEMLK